MSKLVFDKDTVSNYKNNFMSEKNNFESTSYYTFSNSYLNHSGESIISQMASSLETEYKKIDKGYNSINDYWTDYIEASDSLEYSFKNFGASCSNSTVNNYLSSFIGLGSSSKVMKVFEFVKNLSGSSAPEGYTLYKTMNDSYTKYLENNKTNYKTDDYDKIANTKNDEGWINKTTLGLDGKRLDYDHKVTTESGTVVYYDKDGKVVKKINTDGTVDIGDKKIYSNGHVTNKNTGATILEDGSSYTINADGGYELTTSDGKHVSYDKNGNVKSVKNDTGTIKYEYDSKGNVSTITTEKSDSNGFTQNKYNADGSYTSTNTKDNVTTKKSYDSSGKEISNSKTYTGTNSSGSTVKVVEEDGKKTNYNGSNKVESTEETDANGNKVTTKYDKNGNVSSVTTTDKDGTSTTTTNNSDGSGSFVTNSENDNRTSYDENGNKTYEKNEFGETYYHSDGTSTTNYSDGSSKGFYSDGSVKYESNSDGSLTTWYDENGNWTEKEEAQADGTSILTTSDGRVTVFDEDRNILSYKDADGNDLPHF